MDTISRIQSTYESFRIDAKKAKTGNGAAGRRARKAALELMKNLKEFRIESLSWPMSPRDKFIKQQIEAGHIKPQSNE